MTLNTRMDNHESMRGRKRVCRMMSCSLGFLICVLIGIQGVEATVFPQKQPDSIGNRVLVAQSRGNHENRRDPFRPIKKGTVNNLWLTAIPVKNSTPFTCRRVSGEFTI